MARVGDDGRVLVDAVTFDFRGTLVVAGSIDAWMDDAMGSSGETAERSILREVLSEVWARAARRHPDASWDLHPHQHRSAFEEVLIQEASCPVGLAVALYELMPEQWELAPGALQLLTALHGGAVRLAVVSNIAIDIRPRLSEMGLLPLLDQVLLSHEEGLVKPNPQFFERAAARLGADPRGCVVEGDSSTHDGGAVAAGMTCLLVPQVGEVPRLGTAGRLLLAALPRKGITPSQR